MFAFALLDTRKQRLILARDRMGEKPLYLYEDHGRLLFSSELKALLRSGQVPFRLDPEAVDLYFHYQFVPEPRTAIHAVRKLDAAHMLVIDIEPWEVSESCYWNMDTAEPVEADPALFIRQELETIAQLVIRSDVPVGIALSGGLDSSVVAALTARTYPDAMHAFSVGYPGRPRSDERNDARQLANYLGMPFHEVEIDTHEMAEFFPDLVYWRDDPIADISGHGYYAVMRAAREHGIPVVLQGQAGDELFWGYPEVRDAARLSKTKAEILSNGKSALLAYWNVGLPESLSRPSVGRWLRTWGGLKTSLDAFRIHRQAPSDQLFFYDMAPDFPSAMRQTGSLYGPQFTGDLQDSHASGLFRISRPWPNVDVTMTRLICETYLRENGIAQGDRLSMASSVELRLPLVDHRLVETVVGLRKAQSDLDLPPKAWLKAAVSDLLPAWVLDRPKRGFAPPVKEWHKALFCAYGESLNDGYLVQTGVLKPESGKQLAGGPFPRGAITPISFKALVLEQWCRRMSSLA
jgi:asparagine synthase (glutamine-hydrolysing)